MISSISFVSSSRDSIDVVVVVPVHIHQHLHQLSSSYSAIYTRLNLNDCYSIIEFKVKRESIIFLLPLSYMFIVYFTLYTFTEL